MATRVGALVPTGTFATSRHFCGRNGALFALGVRESSIIYLMKGRDSVTATVYSWTSQIRDFTGLGWPGPNPPTGIEIAGARVL